MSGLTRRTIGDYVAKGLLAGPSHRGRGARYSQADADVLQLIPRLRTVLKKDFPNLTSLRAFFRLLSTHDLHMLASKTSERALVMAVRLLRVRTAVSALLPQVAPELITAELERLTPEQIRNIDAGRTQLGAVIDMQSLLAGQSKSDQRQPEQWRQPADYQPDRNDQSGRAEGDEALPSWSVNWLDGSVQTGGPWGAPLSIAADMDETIPPDINELRRDEVTPQLVNQQREDLEDRRHDEQSERLSDIARRLARLEELLVTS